jgi:MtN3 and saliva related transmembrane protein
MLNTAQIFGWIATFLFSIMIVPQMIKTIKEKNVDGVSLILFMIYLVANIFALTYALMIVQHPLIFKYTVAIGITSIYLFIFYFYFSKKEVSVPS